MSEVASDISAVRLVRPVRVPLLREPYPKVYPLGQRGTEWGELHLILGLSR